MIRANWLSDGSSFWFQTGKTGNLQCMLVQPENGKIHDLIDKAAAVRNKTRSDFMLEAACQEAENVLLDRRLFLLKDKDYEAFESALKAPVVDNPSLRKLLAQKAPWES